MAEQRRTRILSVPAAHPYVAAALPDPHLDPVDLLPDPVVDPAEPARWWPPRALEPDWLDRLHPGIDVLHVHFGFDTSEPDALREVVRIVRSSGIVLAVTVHDLHNPHQPDPAAHLERLGVLVRAADVLVTLTPGAAAEVERRWGRRPMVLPHPHLVADHPDARRDAAAPTPVVGVHLKELRPNTDARTALAAVDLLAARGTRVEVRVHRAVLDPAHPRYDPALPAHLEDLRGRPGVEVLAHDRLDDDELSSALARLDAAVLPYRFGTHSGWLQLCRDLGVPVAVPDCGHYAGQVEPAAVATYSTGDAASLAAAVTDLLSRPRPTPTTGPELVDRRDALRRAHLVAYRSALVSARPRSGTARVGDPA